MNRTNFEHAVIAFILTIVSFIVSGNAVYGSGLAAGLFFGREHTSAEYKIIEKLQTKRTPGIVMESLKFWKWSLDSQLDFYFPLITSIATLYIINTYF